MTQFSTPLPTTGADTDTVPDGGDVLRRASAYYDASYPPDILGVGGAVLTSLTPNRLMQGAPKVVMCIGSGYSDTTQVFRDGVDMNVSGWGGDPTQLEYVDPNDTVGPHSIRVHEGGKQSPPRTLTVVPTPVIDAFTPASVVAGVPTLIVATGTGFTAALVAYVNLSVAPDYGPFPVTYVSPTEVHFTANVPVAGAGVGWLAYDALNTSNASPFAVTATREGEDESAVIGDYQSGDPDADVEVAPPKPRRKNGNGG